jgi:SnoaL-like domain
MTTTHMAPRIATVRMRPSSRLLQSVLDALNKGEISKAVDQFDDHFTFADHALALEFTDKGRLAEFFQKSRELFPDALVEIISTFQSGDYTIAEWKLTATHTVPQTMPHYGSWGGLRVPIALRGASIVRIEKGRIIHWSDYYDQTTSRRMSLAAFFTEWIEY